MSAPHHGPDAVPVDLSERGARGATEPLASMLEYVQRLNHAGRAMAAELDKLRGLEDWLVLCDAYGRIGEWHPDAVVMGPPGVFLISPIWASPEPTLWISAERCRQRVHTALGPDFTGAVEIVFFSPRGPDPDVPARIIRAVGPPAAGLPGFSGILIECDDALARLLTEYEPMGGLQRLSTAWIREMAEKAKPRAHLVGPDPRVRMGADERPRW